MMNWKKRILCLLLPFFTFCIWGTSASAQEEPRILEGIFADEISLEGMTVAEAKAEIEAYVEGLKGKQITLIAVNGNEVIITPADLGFFWCNQEIVDEAVSIGQTGNIVQRYKASRDLRHTNKVFSLQFDIDTEMTKHILTEQCSVYNVKAIDAKLSRVDEEFIVNQGQTGKIIDEAASASLLCRFMDESWSREDDSVDLVIIEDEPRGTEEELAKVQNLLGSFSTSFRTSGKARSANVINGCSLINGTTLYPGDEFSTYSTVSPFSEANGYYMAGSYLNGQVVDSLGGGICQVSTTLYNAVLLSELEVTERHNHSMIVTYVEPSADAAIAESSGKDFKFVNNTQAPIYIEGYTTDDKNIVFHVYGMETRESSRVVSYESEVISKTYPDTEVIYTDPALPVGSVSVQSAHIGYKANLWKIVSENGSEVSREIINSSVYKMAPRTATVGIATEDPNIYNQIMAAVASNSIDEVKNVSAALAASVAPPAPPAEEPPAPEALP